MWCIGALWRGFGSEIWARGACILKINSVRRVQKELRRTKKAYRTPVNLFRAVCSPDVAVCVREQRGKATLVCVHTMRATRLRHPNCDNPPTPPTIMRGKPLSEDARRIVLLMAISHHIPVKDISAWTGIPLRSIQRIVSLY